MLGKVGIGKVASIKYVASVPKYPEIKIII